MKKIITLFLSTLFISALAAQPLKKHQGKLSNGYTDAGTISYTYRNDPKTGEEIKYGTFRYNVKAREDQYRFYHNISGNYTNNLKDGNWSYKINQKDFRMQHPGRYTTGTVSLEAQYKMGFPDGIWRYESILKSRSGEKKQDKWYWQNHDTPDTVSATIQFKEGLITGSFQARKGGQMEVTGQFDNQGFFDGTWVTKSPDSIVTRVYDHGIEVKCTITDQEGNVLHMEDNSKNISVLKEYQRLRSEGNDAKVKEFSFTLDTVSLLQQREDPLYRFLQETVYHSPYVLSKEIGGDKTVYYDHQRYRMRFTLRGMNQITIRNRISTEQVQYYSRIGTLVSRMESHMNHIYKLRRDGQLPKSSGDVIKLMEFNMDLARRYACIGETLKLYREVTEGIEASENSCVYLKSSIEKLPSFKTRGDALKYLMEKVTLAEKQNEAHYNQLTRKPGP